MASRRKKHVEHEEHVNHERWLITYADMITLLMVLFIVLFSMSQVDLAKYQKLKTSLSGALGGSDSPIQGGAGVLSSGTSPIPLESIAVQARQALESQQAQQAAQAEEKEQLEATKEALGAQLEKVGLGGSVGMRVERRGLVVTIASDQVLFEPGQAQLRPAGRALIDELAAPLAALPNPLRIEGHTDDVPINGAFPSNWELSTARATTVLRELATNHGIDSARLSATGYADQKSIAANSTADGRARNRRVEILVEAATNREES